MSDFGAEQVCSSRNGGPRQYKQRGNRPGCGLGGAALRALKFRKGSPSDRNQGGSCPKRATVLQAVLASRVCAKRVYKRLCVPSPYTNSIRHKPYRWQGSHCTYVGLWPGNLSSRVSRTHAVVHLVSKKQGFEAVFGGETTRYSFPSQTWGREPRICEFGKNGDGWLETAFSVNNCMIFF